MVVILSLNQVFNLVFICPPVVTSVFNGVFSLLLRTAACLVRQNVTGASVLNWNTQVEEEDGHRGHERTRNHTLTKLKI